MVILPLNPPITEEQANKIYDVFVEIANVRNRVEDRCDFIYHHTKEEPTREYTIWGNIWYGKFILPQKKVIWDNNLEGQKIINEKIEEILASTI